MYAAAHDRGGVARGAVAAGADLNADAAQRLTGAAPAARFKSSRSAA
jgi:hypothetical protein